MDPSRVSELKAFVDACKKDPAILADPSLAFFRDYLASLGADLPQAAAANPAAGPKVTSMDDIDEDDDDDGWADDDLNMRDPTPEPDELDEDIVESDLELDEDDVVQPDHDDAPQKMGDASVEVTEESRDASQEAKGMAMEAMSQVVVSSNETMGQAQRGEAPSSSGIYTYRHRGDKGVDIHEIFVKRSRTRVLMSYAGVVFLLAIVCQSLLGKVRFCCKSAPDTRGMLSESKNLSNI